MKQTICRCDSKSAIAFLLLCVALISFFFITTQDLLYTEQPTTQDQSSDPLLVRTSNSIFKTPVIPVVQIQANKYATSGIRLYNHMPRSIAFQFILLLSTLFVLAVAVRITRAVVIQTIYSFPLLGTNLGGHAPPTLSIQ